MFFFILVGFSDIVTVGMIGHAFRRIFGRISFFTGLAQTGILIRLPGIEAEISLQVIPVKDADGGEGNAEQGQGIEKMQIERLMQITPDHSPGKADQVNLPGGFAEKVFLYEFHNQYSI